MPNFSTISPLVILFILCVFSFYCLQGIETNLINNSLKAYSHLDIFYCENAKQSTQPASLLTIVSLNVRGLGNNAKRKEVFNWLRAKKQSIYMLQEVHCSQDTTDIWTCEWEYKALFSCCSSNKAGVGILFNNNFNFKINKVFSDPNGRFLICDIVADSKRLTVANIYAPNEDDPNFFQVFFDHLSSFKCEEIIIGGGGLQLSS